VSLAPGNQKVSPGVDGGHAGLVDVRTRPNARSAVDCRHAETKSFAVVPLSGECLLAIRSQVIALRVPVVRAADPVLDHGETFRERPRDEVTRRDHPVAAAVDVAAEATD